MVEQYYDYEKQEWINPTLARKLEFYSMGGKTTSKDSKWPEPITKFPKDFSDFKKPYGKTFRWDYDKILRAYRKFHPWVTIEQVKHHKSLLNITIAFPRYVNVDGLEIDHPKDFTDYVTPYGKTFRWDYEGIVKLYEDYGVTRDIAYHHFKHLKDKYNIKGTQPFIKTNEVWHIPAHVLGPFDGGHVTITPVDRELDPAMLKAKTTKSRLADYLAEKYDKESVKRELWHRYSIHVEI